MQNCQEQTQNIIILHGWGSSAKKWQAVKQQLEQTSIDPFSSKPRENGSMQIATPDLPGFKKETALSRVWNLDDYTGWLEKLVEARPLPILIGHSFGGRMAIKFAAQNPEKLKALILVSSAGIKQNNGDPFSTKSGENGSPLTFTVTKVGKYFSFLPFFSVFRKIFYRYILRKIDYINAEKFPFLKETFKNIIAEDLTPYLEKIKTPCLIIWGDKDKMTPVSDAYLMNKKIPNSKLEILKNIGHAPHLECPEVLAEKIQNFINSIN